MKKTRKMVNVKWDIYAEGCKAAQDGNPRFAPYAMGNNVQTWFAGYDSVKLLTGNTTSDILQGIGVTE